MASKVKVLNLVINGLPSIRKGTFAKNLHKYLKSFKPCYKWITFNTSQTERLSM